MLLFILGVTFGSGAFGACDDSSSTTDTSPEFDADESSTTDIADLTNTDLAVDSPLDPAPEATDSRGEIDDSKEDNDSDPADSEVADRGFEGVDSAGEDLGEDVALLEDDAEVVIADLPQQLACGETYLGSVTMRNTGTATWTTATGYKLGTVDDEDPFHPGTREWLPAGVSVSTGESHRFQMELVAPAIPGSYVTDWQMVHEGLRWFGEIASAEVEVSCRLPVDPATLIGKHLLGYQGWFGCPNDGSALNRWVHWSRGEPAPDTMTIDAWPDLNELSDAELCPTAFAYGDGSVAGLYSAYRQETVVRHTQWMQNAGIDGVFLQRFTNSLLIDEHRAFKDQVALNIRAGCEQNGRVFAVMYDISGTAPGDLIGILQSDWAHLVDDLGLIDSPQYLHHDGLPVLAVWGFGFHNRPGSAADAAFVIEHFKHHPDPRYRVFLWGGVPTHWRDLDQDSKTDPAWRDVYLSFDVLSPWAVGRYGDATGADAFRRNQIELDMEITDPLGILYAPVIFPGFSWANLVPDAVLNQTPRDGGNFYWRQAYNAIDAGSAILYTAMFDEVDEATAMFKLAERQSDLPTTGQFLSLDIDGYSLPSDWYLRLAGAATRQLRGEEPLTVAMPITD